MTFIQKKKKHKTKANLRDQDGVFHSAVIRGWLVVDGS